MQEHHGAAETAIPGHDAGKGVDSGETETLPLGAEARAAVIAVTDHLRSVAATATTEAQLSVASISAVAAAALASLLLVIAAWLCLIAAGVWLAVENGLSGTTALLIAAAINVAVVLLLFLWSKGLIRNIGFSRTRQLVFRGYR
jgi:hypothetical protein